ncbi:Metaxin-1 [Hondaea fermentalgiana]|uniref:Metaxin-1 n=1 Tax=Hondaea fermentalgiana TaxID=2315210 RepID=A0A2R5G5T1_9STRA|nr:Metaxin-1 [Hondaea fermentalgiana]|eukprot:GBG25895.1 Metaxin-1 [Hondaea fermentalgiana]
MAGGSAQVALVQFRPAWAEQAYLRWAKIAHVVENWSQPWSSSAGTLPQLHGKDRSIVPSREIIRYLRDVENLDAKLSDAQRAQLAGFESLIRNDLHIALEWSRWADDEHYSRVTRKILVDVMPFPMSYAWAWFQRQAVLFRLRQHHSIDSEEAAKRVAAQAYEALTLHLGDGPWMFGEIGPTSLDCLVFGHLMDALREPIGAICFASHPKLVAFCKRVQKDLFDEPTPAIANLCGLAGEPNRFSESQGFNTVYRQSALRLSGWGDEAEGSKDAQASDEEKSLSKREREFQEGSRNAIMLAGGAVAGYLLYSNLVAFSFEDEEDDEYDEYDDDEDFDDDDDDDEE